MSLESQAEVVWECSEFIANYIRDDERSQLRMLNDFYVEVIYSKNDNAIVQFKTFKKGSRLEKYLDDISLDELL